MRSCVQVLLVADEMVYLRRNLVAIALVAHVGAVDSGPAAHEDAERHDSEVPLYLTWSPCSLLKMLAMKMSPHGTIQ